MLQRSNLAPDKVTVVLISALITEKFLDTLQQKQ
jgi:hypothetical protein